MTDDAGSTGGASPAGVRAEKPGNHADGDPARNSAAAEEDRIARGTGVQEQIARGESVREQNRVGAPGPGGVNAAGAGRVGTPEQALVGMPERRVNLAERNRVPSWLQTGAAWSWRLLLLAVAIYLIARILGVLYIVVVPCIAALLLTALLQPLTARLRRAGLPGLAATWATLLIAAAVLGGLGLLVTTRVSADYPTLVAEAKHTTTQVVSLLSGAPFHLKSTTSLKNLLNNIPSYLSKHKSLVEGTVVTGGKIAAEFFGGLVLMLFVTFFLIKDGERIWNWLLGAMRPDTARRIDRAGHASWLAVVYYMRGTVAVAAIHAAGGGDAGHHRHAGHQGLGRRGHLARRAGHRGPAGGAPAPAAGGRPGDTAPSARGHSLPRDRRRAGRHPWRRGRDPGGRRDHPGAARAAAPRPGPRRARRPIRCDSVPTSRYPHRACQQEGVFDVAFRTRCADQAP
jgi:hypothetical protein